MLRSFRADATILPDVPVRYPEADALPAVADSTRFRIAVVCSFTYDEPVPIIVGAAHALPEVEFLVTGDPKKVERLKSQFPSNMTLTGFLDSASYGRLLRDADGVMALTTAQHTMLRAAYEAVYQGTPIIVSDSPILRQEFDQGGVVVRNTVEEIVRAVRSLQQEQPRYRREVQALRDRKERRWEHNKQLLLAKIGRTTGDVHPA
jgi:glycosyltransferase involved in cell wall biosynthesis